MIIRPDPLTREFALGAIARLNARRTGEYRFDAWIDYAIRQWLDFLSLLTQRKKMEHYHVPTPRQ